MTYQYQESIDNEIPINSMEEILNTDSNIQYNSEDDSYSGPESNNISGYSDYDSDLEDTNYLEEIPLKDKFIPYLYKHQIEAINAKAKYKKCLVNMWCGTGKTRTFTVSIFNDEKNLNVIVFPSLGLINQYNNDYFNNDNEFFNQNFSNYQCLAFCSDDEGKLNIKNDRIKYTTKQSILDKFLKKSNCKKIILVTYQSFEKFINECIKHQTIIDYLIWDEAHHILGEKIQNIAFNNKSLDRIVDKKEYYTATPINRNSITMYDREEEYNSDCGPLAYEYLFYQAVEDKICKPFQTQISLYMEKPEYKSKYIPIFESIIRACLSGSYDYWNVLTYHRYVNDNENQSISSVKEFASKNNEKILKKLFIRIQNDEFPNTKNIFNVDDVKLEGVDATTKNRQKIINDFDQKVVGRIYILASCGILNEGIDTKWANMGVPIDPTQSIVKESQRIGRLVRLPEPNMPPAIILIPCLVDITKYNTMDTDERKDEMIRQELSESGNFNTALNVISAFRYQYDPELFELCIKYPNMYEPQEIEDNLLKHGLEVLESKGNLLENLKFICNQDNIDLDVESFEETNEINILNDIAEKCEKTIEVHTQSYDNPVIYYNENAFDLEPLRLFYSEDDKTYSPVVKKDKKEKIIKKTISAPKKRPKLFDIHTHPDLEVLWKIKDVNLNKMFGQGILDVDIKYNDKKWNTHYELLKEYMLNNDNQCPTSYLTISGIKLGSWINRQRQDKKKNKLSQDRITKLESLQGWVWEFDLDEEWNTNYELLKEYMLNNNNQCPTQSYETTDGIKIGFWIGNQRQNKKKNKLSQDRITKLESLQGWFWELDLDEGWYTNYELLKEYMLNNNNQCPTQSYVTTGGIKIGSWIVTQRQNKKKNKLSQDRITKLESLQGWFWELDFDDGWYTNYELLKEYMLNNNNKCPTWSYETTGGIKIGNWIHIQRQNKKQKKLSEDRITKLDSLQGWFWDPLDEEWNTNYELLKEYMLNNNNKCPTWSYETTEGVKIGKWVSHQRHKKKNNLSQDRITKLESLQGWFWDPWDEEWNTNYELLKEYMLKNNNQCPTRSYETTEGIKIDSWISHQRKNKKQNKLSPDRITKLESLQGWFWDLDEGWNTNYVLLKTYMLKNNNQCPTRSYETTDGVKIGGWISTQRDNKKKNKLSQDKITKLESLQGWFWELDLDEGWNTNYVLLKTYMLKNNNQCPTASYETTDGVKIGRWISKQRDNKKKYKLSQDKITKLESLQGWFWEQRKKKKNMSKPTIITQNNNNSESKEKRQIRQKNELSELHKKYKT